MKSQVSFKSIRLISIILVALGTFLLLNTSLLVRIIGLTCLIAIPFLLATERALTADKRITEKIVEANKPVERLDLKEDISSKKERSQLLERIDDINLDLDYARMEIKSLQMSQWAIEARLDGIIPDAQRLKALQYLAQNPDESLESLFSDILASDKNAWELRLEAAYGLTRLRDVETKIQPILQQYTELFRKLAESKISEEARQKAQKALEIARMKPTNDT